jgi:hypothetical protein
MVKGLANKLIPDSDPGKQGQQQAQQGQASQAAA